MTTSTTTKPILTGKKAMHMNMALDGIKIRSASFKNKKAYDRKNKTWKKEY